MSEPASDLRRPSDADDGEELVEFLERDQLAADRARRLAPAVLGPRAQVALWSLRIFALVVSALVIYTFVVSLAT